jgi:endonuclease-3
MNKKQKAALCVSILEGIYPEVVCALESGGDPWRLLVMGRLSAQCTDARVNEVCRQLFREIPDINAMAKAELSQIERLIFSCGLYKTKAQSLKGMAEKIVNEYGSRVPDTMEELLTLPGVGRKIANLILGDVYGKPAIVADTHCIRISARLGFCPPKSSPEKTEKILKGLIEPEKQSDFCHRIVQFGRDTCSSRSPKCAECPLSELCAEHKKNKSKES